MGTNVRIYVRYPALCSGFGTYVFPLSDLVYQVSFQLIRAPPRVFIDVHVDVHALTHGVIILASSNLEEDGGLVDVLGAEIVRIVPIFLRLASLDRIVRRREGCEGKMPLASEWRVKKTT